MSLRRHTRPSTASAWAVPATRSRWRRLMALVLVAGIVGLGLLIGAAVSWNAGRHDSNARTAQAPGVVVDVQSRRVGGRSGAARGDVTVEFFTGSETKRVVISLSSEVLQYSVGETVTVRFQPTNPNNAAVLGTPGRSSGWMVAAVFGVAITAMTMWVGRHLRRMRWVLERYPWQARPSRVGEIPFQTGLRARAQIVVVLWDPIDERETIVMPLGLRRLNPKYQPVTWLCGDTAADRVVISTPGGRRPLLARRVSAPHWAAKLDYPCPPLS